MIIKNFITISFFVISSVFASYPSVNLEKSQDEIDEESYQLVPLTLIGESHAAEESTKFVYYFMKLFDNTNLLIERDKERLNDARLEVNIIENEKWFANDSEFKKKYNYMTYTQYLDKTNLSLKTKIYKSDQENQASHQPNDQHNQWLFNRFWFWKILKDFNDRVISIDASVEEVKKRL